MHQIIKGIALGAALVSPSFAQSFTTAAEVRPILQATKPQWIAVREFDGQDLLYFTHLLSWRCGLQAVRYGLNGAAPDSVLAMESCHEAEAAPNALKTPDAIRVYLTLPLGSVQTVTVVAVFDDGGEEVAEYDRQAILTP